MTEICSICGKPIADNELWEYKPRTSGVTVGYVHKDCLFNKLKYFEVVKQKRNSLLNCIAMTSF